MKRIILALMALGLMLTAACSSAIATTTQTTATQTTAAQTTTTEATAAQEENTSGYAEILQKYQNAIREAWDYEKLSMEGMCLMLADSGSKTGYAITDLDEDGTMELIIAAQEDAPEALNKMVFSLYTLENGKPRQLFQAGERDRYEWIGDNRFANEGSSGADDSVSTILKLENGTLIDIGEAAGEADYRQMKLLPIIG